ncbi:hypothetical protein [Halospeciosus flavus]|uniref:Uncharacterized protein n=1 Tax=Halospeciosus flavus TaxID=3032283 RepID=A0ABD5Z7R1_9EURY|nr:hypothetical protein [Halospeciosus flavus]
MFSGDVVFVIILAAIFLFIIALLLLLRRTISGYREGVEDAQKK